MSDSFRNHFIHTATWEKYKGVNRANEAEYEPGVEIACRIIRRSEVIKLPNSEEALSRLTIYTEARVGNKDRIDGESVFWTDEWISLYNDEYWGTKCRL